MESLKADQQIDKEILNDLNSIPTEDPVFPKCRFYIPSDSLEIIKIPKSNNDEFDSLNVENSKNKGSENEDFSENVSFLSKANQPNLKASNGKKILKSSLKIKRDLKVLNESKSEEKILEIANSRDSIKLDTKLKESEKKSKASRNNNDTAIPSYLRKSSQTKQNNLDHLLNIVGSFGLYQRIQFLLVGFLAILPSMVAFSYVFVSATPNFTCRTAREVVLVSYDHAPNRNDILINLLLNQGEEILMRNIKNSEYLVENKRYIRLLTDERIKNSKSSIVFDNKCDIKENIKSYRTEKNRTKSSSALSWTKLFGKKSNTSAKILKSSVNCVEWFYDDSVYGRTTVTEWNLICLKSHLKAATQNAFILGTGCSVFTGILSDRFGRRTALILMITLMFLVLNITQFLMHNQALTINQKFIIFTISRFLQGIAQTMYSISFVLLLEITGPKHRVTAGNMLAYSFSIGQMIIVILAYFFKDSHKIQWTLAIYVLPFFLYYWIVPESPRWLLSSDKVSDARRVLQKITRVNQSYQIFLSRIRKNFPFFFKIKKNSSFSVDPSSPIDLNTEVSSAYMFTLLQEEANKLTLLKKNTSYRRTLTGILKSPLLMRRCFIIFYNWMIILAVYLGIGMGISGNLDKVMNPYLVFFIAAICEFMSIVTCHLVLDRFGRKYTLIAFMAICSIAIYLIPVYFNSYPKVAIVFYFLSKYAIGAAQLTCMIYTSELYPTPMRSTGVGLSVALARLGGVWAPQINVLSSTLGSIYIPFIIFSIATLISCILTLFLPETLNKPLPENLIEAKYLGRRNKN